MFTWEIKTGRKKKRRQDDRDELPPAGWPPAAWVAGLEPQAADRTLGSGLPVGASIISAVPSVCWQEAASCRTCCQKQPGSLKWAWVPLNTSTGTPNACQCCLFNFLKLAREELLNTGGHSGMGVLPWQRRRSSGANCKPRSLGSSHPGSDCPASGDVEIIQIDSGVPAF